MNHSAGLTGSTGSDGRLKTVFDKTGEEIETSISKLTRRILTFH